MTRGVSERATAVTRVDIAKMMGLSKLFGAMLEVVFAFKTVRGTR